MKILITGGSGFLGQYLNIELSKSHEILTVYNKRKANCGKFNSVSADLNNRKLLEEIISSFKPDCVVHTAAVTSQNEIDTAGSKYVFSTNVKTVKNIAELCNKNNARLIYTSTDLVYAGYRGSMLKEESKLIPVSLYAESKLMGEVKIRETFDNFIILRTATLYGTALNGSLNHFYSVYKSLKNGERVQLFTDQFRTPLYVNDAARMIGEICKKDIKGATINFGGKERLSRAELGERLCDAAGFDKNLIDKIPLDDKPDYPKVEDVSMNTDKLQSYGINQMTVEEALKDIVNNFS